ncbi:MAG: hypothetical protein GOMPHAMPRED_003566 [Gomphillus americanus]|uniref:F-box domain-containing protein n=1 Tax=Gomphillus americanus TaxID=1940652 RepID=A0A8H3IKI2_9LECA|nr:MAG: hypothetical protein GOMPHAMPRED_003566 [Gomphillus americanus]
MVPFRLLDLPLELQRMIYRDVVLTDDRRIYVDMESWFNPNLRNGFSMMLTCKKLYVEIGTILFQESIWYSDTQDTFARRYDGINMLKLIERHPLPRKESRIGRVIANSKFNIKHLDFLWDNGSINKDLVAPQSHIWNMQLDSLTMRINIPTENFLREQFHRMHGGIDVRQLDPDLFADEWKTCLSDPPIPRNQWPLGLFNLKELPTYTQLLRLVVRIPYVEFRQVNGTHQAARNTDDFAKWLTRGLRQEWLRGSPSLPGIEWLFLDPTSPSTWQGTTTSISNILTSGELDL